MDELKEKLIDRCNLNGYSKEEMSLINKAILFMMEQHKGMKRKNKEEYIVHPLTVALIVANLSTDYLTVTSALVHETILHGNSSFSELEELFGDTVKEIVSSLTKVNNLHLTDDSESSSTNIKKMMVALSQDVRVLILKLAGRLHNMRTIEGLPKYLQKQKALETWNVLIPIAHRLGINQIASELEDICFRYLNPEIYEEIEASLPSKREYLNNILENMIEDIIEILRVHDLKFEIKGRVKSVSSIHNKLSSGHQWSNIYDILGIRIICEEISDCYLIIGLIHSLFKPIPKRFKDYIAMPKGNSYQSLHTGIYGEENYPVEVQVRTKEMDEIAEHGVASHWSYKEKNSKNIQNVMEQKLQMFRNMLETNSDDISDDDFISKVNQELLSNSIYVYTPAGDVMELPEHSTPIDFAYRIHSKVGDETVGAIVNDVMVSLDYELKDNDVVKIKTVKGNTPNKDWLSFVKTTQAKNKIKSFFSKKDREEYIIRGKDLFERELKRQHIPISKTMDENLLSKLMTDLKVGSLEEIYLSIGSFRYTPIYVVNLLFDEKKDVADAFLERITNNLTINKVNHKNDIIVSNCDDLLVNLASCCKPIYGDEIVGYITKGHGITVHEKNCHNIKDIHERLIEVSWNKSINDEEKEYISRVTVITNGIDNKLFDIVTKATIRNINITNVSEYNQNEKINYNLLLKVHSKDDLDLFVSDLLSIPYITDIRRY